MLETRFKEATCVIPHKRVQANPVIATRYNDTPRTEDTTILLATGAESRSTLSDVARDRLGHLNEFEDSQMHTNTKMENYSDHDDLMDTIESKKYIIWKQELCTPSPTTDVKKLPTIMQKKKKWDGALFHGKADILEKISFQELLAK